MSKCPDKGSSTLGHEVVYLSGYVVECSLKALLLTRHPHKKHEQLVEWFKSDVKHNLERLLIELTRKGVRIPKDQYLNFKHVRTSWYSEMRYDFEGWGYSEADQIVQASERLLAWVKGS